MIDILIARGFKLVPVDGKRPMGVWAVGWPEHDFTAAEIHSILKTYAEPGIGLKLENLIDFDGDTPEAAAMADSLQLPESVAWQSARGRHELFRLTPEQAGYFATSGKILLDGLELRTGINSQSVLPPANGRTWLISLEECDPLKLPDSVFERIKALIPVRETPVYEHDDSDDDRPLSQWDRKVAEDWGVFTAAVFDKLGYKHVGSNPGGGELYRHPSATQKQSLVFGHDNVDGIPLVHSYSPNCNGLPQGESVKPHTALAIMMFDRDFTAAARFVGGKADHDGSEFLDEVDFPEMENEPFQEKPVVVAKSQHILNLNKTPEPDDLIYDFILGKYVQQLIPYTEAYPPAILFQLLEVAGILAGRKTYFEHGDYPFRLNGGTIVIGESGVSRKGTGLMYARLPFRDHELEHDISTLISENTQVSGEGFIQAIANKENHTLLVACEEFASVLKSSKREGSNLSTIIRNAMDAKSLGIDARKNAIPEMHDCFASLIGHCTLDEFISNISLEDISNGFLNRFQFTMSRQNSKIAFPKSVPDHIKNPVRTAFANLMGPKEFAEKTVLAFTPDAEPVWEEFYYKDGEDRSSLRESLSARAPAQVLRNASRIALLEGTTVVDARRLRIALAMLDYSARCIDYIFGDYLNGDEDDLLQFLMSDKNGKSLHDVNEWVARWRKSKRQIKRTLSRLTDKGVVANRPVKMVDGAGRPANRFIVNQDARKSS